MHKPDRSGFKEKMGERNGRTDIDHAQKEEKGQSPEGWCGFVVCDILAMGFCLTILLCVFIFIQSNI